MRKIYHSFITKEEVISLESCKREVLGNNNKVLVKILNKLKKDFDFSVKKESYCLMEHMPGGHQWHRDVGVSNHMSWCEVGISILIKEPISGGNTYYADDDKETNKTKIERGLYDLIVHTSDEWHMVEPHKGKREVFLIFI